MAVLSCSTSESNSACMLSSSRRKDVTVCANYDFILKTMSSQRTYSLLSTSCMISDMLSRRDCGVYTTCHQR